jgi:hypothetical protein
MRGSDLTQEQLDAAEKFILLMRSKTNDLHPTGDQQIAQRWCDLVRIVALYGAIRAKAVADGNPADVAGEVYKTGKQFLISDEESEKLSGGLQGERAEAGRYQWEPGKRLIDCRLPEEGKENQ